ncbi:MAG: GNAT family N-acetyltransferase [Clostridia bacterium]|nr:GNAT family N-acetyltransferase [Clostridia bacterium]
MGKVTIRKATSQELEIIQNLNNELFKLEKEKFDSTLVNDWPLTKDGKMYFEDLINSCYVIVAILNDEIVGYLAGTINEKGSYEEIQYGEINNMLIKENCRGFGIGKLLVDNFKNYCKKNKINNLKVEASAKNISAINFYKKNGFKDFNITLTQNLENI